MENKELDPLASLDPQIFSDEEHKKLAKENVTEIKNLDELNLMDDKDKNNSDDKKEDSTSE